MNNYYVKRFYRTSISLSKNRKSQQGRLPTWKFHYPKDDVFVAIKDSVKRVDDLNFHYGLDVIVQVKAKDENEAVNLSMMYSEATVNMLVFASLAICYPPKLISIISNCDLEAGQFRENIYPQDLSQMIIKLSPLSEGEFSDIYDLFNGCELSSRERIMRATSWLRKGMAEKHTIDKFISFWIGIEVIKNILRKRLKKTNDEWKGVKDIFQNKLENANFEKIKDARQRLFHGFGELSPEFHEEISSYVNSVMFGLIWSIAEILGVNEENIRRAINNANWKKTLNVWHVCGGDIHGLEGELEKDVENFPKVKMIDNNVEYNFNDDETITMKLNPTFAPVSNSKKISWKLNFVEIRGE